MSEVEINLLVTDILEWNGNCESTEMRSDCFGVLAASGGEAGGRNTISLLLRSGVASWFTEVIERGLDQTTYDRRPSQKVVGPSGGYRNE